MRLGLVLSGGGARGAYQTGVIRALADLLLDKGLPNPFPVVCGISAGSINAAYYASKANDLRAAADGLVELWSGLRSESVFRTDSLSLSRQGFRWLGQLALGGLGLTKKKKRRARALLDASPLGNLLGSSVDFEKVRANLASGVIDALSITATDYSNGYVVSFVESREAIDEWTRTRRIGKQSKLDLSHLMASASIPLIFPPVKVGERYFGDGGLRNTAPLSPAIHLGAEAIVIVGVKKKQTAPYESTEWESSEPTIGRILSLVINGILMDAFDLDIERLERVNEMLGSLDAAGGETGTHKPVRYVWIQPSEDIAGIAQKWARLLPKGVHYLVRGMGSDAQAADLISYMLFESEYCKELIELGYRDAMASRRQLLDLIQGG